MSRRLRDAGFPMPRGLQQAVSPKSGSRLPQSKGAAPGRAEVFSESETRLLAGGGEWGYFFSYGMERQARE